MIRYGFLVAATLATLAVTITAQQPPPASATSKLTTVLADLAGTVAQESRAVSTQRVGASAVNAADILRATSVKDAVQGRRLRIDASNQVQVYILVDAVTDAVQRQLTDAGVTIDGADAASRRVQAHLPVTRLTAVAQLGIVNAIRLPTYARPRVGATTSEGDSILSSDAARAQFALDGTGVRVGVISDGIKGIFEALCTTCTGIATGPMATNDLPTAIGTRNAAGGERRHLRRHRRTVVSSEPGSRSSCRRRRHRRARSRAPAPRVPRCSRLSTTSRRARSCPSPTATPISRSTRP